ncbi:MAG: GIY-YIG nuclease family protein [Thermoplasmata archaeon]|nr:MAG: GIY-YIG nuclease family protein [Thermoplasmata archaeon]RLF35083.1 MAG: GIY-YIG nuclease family protein [Thermoplasmata archaeon]
MKGCYLLVVELKNNKKISVGKLGDIRFQQGFYVYVGSALNGLEQRIQRHLKKQKKTYWHIDYLLKEAAIKKVFYKEGENKEECNIAKKLGHSLTMIHGFGCSDCTCKSHLFYGTYKEIIKNIEKLEFSLYIAKKK